MRCPMHSSSRLRCRSARDRDHSRTRRGARRARTGRQRAVYEWPRGPRIAEVLRQSRAHGLSSPRVETYRALGRYRHGVIDDERRPVPSRDGPCTRSSVRTCQGTRHPSDRCLARECPAAGRQRTDRLVRTLPSRDGAITRSSTLPWCASRRSRACSSSGRSDRATRPWSCSPCAPSRSRPPGCR